MANRSVSLPFFIGYYQVNTRCFVDLSCHSTVPSIYRSQSQLESEFNHIQTFINIKISFINLPFLYQDTAKEILSLTIFLNLPFLYLTFTISLPNRNKAHIDTNDSIWPAFPLNHPARLKAGTPPREGNFLPGTVVIPPPIPLPWRGACQRQVGWLEG